MMIIVTNNNPNNAKCQHLTAAEATSWVTECYARINKTSRAAAAPLAVEFIAKVTTGDDQTIKHPANNNQLSFRRI